MTQYEPELGQTVLGQPHQEIYPDEILLNAMVFIRQLLSLYYEDDPFANSGARYQGKCFEVEAYSWNESHDQPFNFKYKDLEISWYKYFARGISTNYNPPVRFIVQMIQDIASELEVADVDKI